MANNRLYIWDSETGETFMLAKSNGQGWWMWYGEDKASRIDELTKWLEFRDVQASYGNTDDQPTKLGLITENEPAYMEVVNAEVAAKARTQETDSDLKPKPE